MWRFVCFLGLITVMTGSARSEGIICLVTGPMRSCDDLVANPLTWSCSYGEHCSGGMCPGNPTEQRSNVNWDQRKRTAREAKTGETGTTGQLNTRQCLAKRDCVCNWDPMEFAYVCALGGPSTHVVVHSFDYEFLPPGHQIGTCEGPPPPPGGGGSGGSGGSGTGGVGSTGDPGAGGP
jgi:hypothetical protein